MVIKEVVQENRVWQDFDDNREETLSFSDLPMTDNSFVGWDNDFSKEDQSSSYDQDFFEFFREDFSASSTYPKDNIIFCGKLITYKGAGAARAAAHHQKAQSQEFAPKSSRGFLPGKSQSFGASTRTNSWSKQNLHHEKHYETRKSFPVDDTFGVSRKRASNILTTTSGKSRSYLFGSWFPTEMELRDIKKRQRKRQTAKMVVSSDKSEKVKSGRRNKAKGLWGLLRVFVCSNQPNPMVKANSLD